MNYLRKVILFFINMSNDNKGIHPTFKNIRMSEVRMKLASFLAELCHA